MVQFIVPPVPDSYARNILHFVKVPHWWPSPPWSHESPFVVGRGLVRVLQMDRSSRFIPAIEFCGVRLLPTFPVARLLFKRILFTRSCMMVSSILDGEFDRRQSFNLGPSPRERHLRILPFTLEVGLSRQLPQSEHIPWCGMRTKHSVSEKISDALFSRPGRSTSWP